MKKVKAVILCGGQGSRIRDVSEVLPKPMIPIGGKPILWHIMKIYAKHGITDFVLALGYKGWVIKDFFLNYYAKTSDITVNLGKQNDIIYHDTTNESDWKITLVETGEHSLTGTRVRKVKRYVEDCDYFAVTYGDGVADINVKQLVDTHEDLNLVGTISGVHPSGRFGEIETADQVITEFNEKPNVSTGLINGGFMLFDQRVFNYFDESKDENFEKDVIPKIVKDKQIGVYVHQGFWECMDTPREYALLNELWGGEEAPWKVWN